MFTRQPVASLLRSLCAIAGVAIASLMIAPSAAVSSVVIKFDDLVVASDPINPFNSFFDVFFEISGPSLGVASYNIQLDVSPPGSGLSLTGAIQPPGPTHPALFPGQSPMVFSTGDSLQAADNLPPGPDAPLVDQIGVIRVNYTVAPATWGVFTLAFDPMFTLLFDGNGDPVPIDSYESGTITVVPEPASLLIWTGLITGGIYLRRRAVRKSITANPA